MSIDTVLTELPEAVADSIASWRRVFSTATTDDTAGLLHNAARDLFRTGKVGKTLWPEAHGVVTQAIADALADMAVIAEIDDDAAQLIYAAAAQDESPAALNGHAAEPPKEALGERQASRFTPTAIDDVQAVNEPAWLIRHLLPARGLACIVGPPKSGKSFMTTDMLFSVARGAPYAGRDTLAGPVIYLTGEGVSGFKRRLIAMRRHYDVEGQGVPFFMIENVPDLGSEKTDLEQLLLELDRFIRERSLERPRAIALDTLARCMGEGDENSARDMGRFVNRCGVIERRFECAVVVVHHMGKNPAAGGRGSNALNGAADVTLTVEKTEAYSTVRVDEMKDGPEGQEWRFRLVPYEISATAETPCATMSEGCACVVELLSEPSLAQPRATKTQKPPAGVVGDLLKVIRRAINESGETNVQSTSVPNNVRAVSRTDLKNYCLTMAWQSDAEPNAFRAMLSKYLSQLRARDVIGFDREWIWLT